LSLSGECRKYGEIPGDNYPGDEVERRSVEEGGRWGDVVVVEEKRPEMQGGGPATTTRATRSSAKSLRHRDRWGDVVVVESERRGDPATVARAANWNAGCSEKAVDGEM
jgi:hypothetical protein